MLLDIGFHNALLGLLFDLRKESFFFASVVACYHLIPALAITYEVFVVFGLDMGGLQVYAVVLLG